MVVTKSDEVPAIEHLTMHGDAQSIQLEGPPPQGFILMSNVYPLRSILARLTAFGRIRARNHTAEIRLHTQCIYGRRERNARVVGDVKANPRDSEGRLVMGLKELGRVQSE